MLRVAVTALVQRHYVVAGLEVLRDAPPFAGRAAQPVQEDERQRRFARKLRSPVEVVQAQPAQLDRVAGGFDGGRHHRSPDVVLIVMAQSPTIAEGSPHRFRACGL